MAQYTDSQTVEIFDRLNTNGNTDWTLSGSGTGEYCTSVADYDSESLFYAGSTKLTSAGTAGSLVAGEFNLDGTTLTVRLPADTFDDVSADSDPDSAPTGHVKGFDQEQTDVITAIASDTEALVSQITLINIDTNNDINCQIFRIEADDTRKALTSKLTLTKADTVYSGAFSLNTGEKFAVISTGAISIDVSVKQRSTT